MHPVVWMLLVAAAGVAIVHSILPDHWVPLAVIGRAERWSLVRAGKIAAWTGVGHVAGSLMLGVILIIVGIGIGSIVRVEGWVVGVILIATGIGFYLWGLSRKPTHGHTHPHPHHEDGHHHHEHGGHASHSHHDHHDHEHGIGDQDHVAPRRGLSWLIPVGVAASPDPTILPVFLAAATLGVVAAVEVVLVYSLVTIISITLLTVLATAGGYQVQWPWLESNAETVTALVLVLMGIASIVAL